MPTTSTVPAIPPGQSGNVASSGPLQVGQTRLLGGRTDKGRAFRAELMLRLLSAEERRGLEEPLRQNAEGTRITAVVGGTITGPMNPTSRRWRPRGSKRS